MLSLDELALKVSLPQQPQIGALQKLLGDCIEEYYGSVDKSQQGNEYISTKMIWDRFDKLENEMRKKVL